MRRSFSVIGVLLMSGFVSATEPAPTLRDAAQAYVDGPASPFTGYPRAASRFVERASDSRIIADAWRRTYALRGADESAWHVVTDQDLLLQVGDPSRLIAEELEGRNPSAFAGLFSRYAIGRERSSHVYGNQWSAVLHSATDHRLAMHVHLAIVDGDPTPDIAAFLRTAERFAASVRAIPWVALYLAIHPSATITIDHVDRRSLDASATEEIIRGLRHVGRERFVGDAERVQR